MDSHKSITSIALSARFNIGAYVDIEIEKNSIRNVVYYCFSSDDTREDGQIRISNDAFALLCSELSDILSVQSSTSIGDNSIHRMKIRYADSNNKIFDNTLSAEILAKVILLIADTSEDLSPIGSLRQYV